MILAYASKIKLQVKKRKRLSPRSEKREKRERESELLLVLLIVTFAVAGREKEMLGETGSTQLESQVEASVREDI